MPLQNKQVGFPTELQNVEQSEWVQSKLVASEDHDEVSRRLRMVHDRHGDLSS